MQVQGASLGKAATEAKEGTGEVTKNILPSQGESLNGDTISLSISLGKVNK